MQRKKSSSAIASKNRESQSPPYCNSCLSRSCLDTSSRWEVSLQSDMSFLHSSFKVTTGTIFSGMCNLRYRTSLCHFRDYQGGICWTMRWLRQQSFLSLHVTTWAIAPAIGLHVSWLSDSTVAYWFHTFHQVALVKFILFHIFMCIWEALWLEK